MQVSGRYILYIFIEEFPIEEFNDIVYGISMFSVLLNIVFYRVKNSLF